jgi:hypothetical protein
MDWRGFLLIALSGLFQVIAFILKGLIRIWEVPAFFIMGFVLGWCLAELIGLEPSRFRTFFQLYLGFLIMLLGARIATRRLSQ